MIRSDVDVKMSSFDGAETSELVGLFLLSQLTHLDVNDGLTACTKMPNQAEAAKKEICKKFNHNKLQITIESNKKSCIFPRHHIGSENSHF